MTSSITKKLFKVQFYNSGQIYEVYVHEIRSADVYGFVELRSFVFGKPMQVVIDPSEDKLRNEFRDVDSCWIPIHSIVRIDSVKKGGTAKIRETDGSNVTPFPIPIPGKKST